MTEEGVCILWRETAKEGDAGAPVNLVCRCMLGPLGGDRTLEEEEPLLELSGSDSEKESEPLVVMRD